MTIKYLDSKRIVGLSTGSVADSNLIFSQSVTPASFTGNNIFALTFSADGTKVYLSNGGQDSSSPSLYTIYQYPLATAWDLSTMGSATLTTSLGNAYDYNPRGIFPKSDGTKFFIAGNQNDSIAQWDDSGTAWTFGGASSMDSNTGGNSLDSYDTEVQDLFFGNSGQYMYIIGTSSDKVHRFDLASAWTLPANGTALDALTHTEYSVVTNNANPTSLWFTDNGKTMLVGSGGSVGKYELATAWQINSGVTFTETYDVSAKETDVQGVTLGDSESKLFICGTSSDQIHKFNFNPKPNNVQDNSIFVEKDTGKRYWFDENKVSTSELKAHYNFDSIGGGTTLTNQATTGDGLGSSANGVNTSITLDTTNEKLGTGAYSFNGSSSKVVLGSASDWTFLSDATSNTWSIAWWMIYDDTLENGHTIMSTTDGSTQTDGFFIDNSGSGTLRLIQVDGNNGSWSSAIPDNTSWHHYAITWNAGTVTLYVDGVSKGTQSQTAGSGTPQYALTLGANNDEYYTELTLDEMGIWKRVLTTSEISALYNSGTGSIITEAKSATWTWDNYVAQFRGIFGGGGGTVTNIMDYITIPTTGNAIDFGDLTVARRQLAGLSSDTRGVFGSGSTGSNTDVMDYVTITTLGNATDFGNVTVARRGIAGLSSDTRGVWGGGYSYTNTMDYITIATLGNATDFGDLTATLYHGAGVSNETRGLFSLGTWGGSIDNRIDYITIATTGNATDFGDLSITRAHGSTVNDSTRGVFCSGYKGGSVWSNVMDYVTVATTGNATDFGDLSRSVEGSAGVSSETRGAIAGGINSGSAYNNIDYITIATLGNSTDFGDLTLARQNLAGGVSGL